MRGRAIVVLGAAALAAVALGAAALTATAHSAAPVLTGVEAEGGDLRVRVSDGRVLTGADLKGAVIDIVGENGRAVTLRIEAVEADTRPTAPDVRLYTVSARQPGGGWEPFCAADPDGRRLAIPFPAADGQGFALTCTAGAVGKCIRLGYRPWAKGPDGASLGPLHAACVRMIRADYGGDGRSWTRNGMRIDISDRLGIQRPETELPFEAGWGPHGAVCVAHPRVRENGRLADITRRVRKLEGRTGAAYCTEARARALGALIFNRSAAN